MSGDPMILKDIWIPQDVLKTILKKSLEFLSAHTSTKDPNELRVATAKNIMFMIGFWMVHEQVSSIWAKKTQGFHE